MNNATRKRITTGSEGLDDMILGGIPEGNQILIIGGPGAGKTLKCFEFLYKNALNGDVGLYVSMEEKIDYIINNSKAAFTKFKDVDKLISKQKIIFYEQNLEAFSSSKTSKSEERYEFSGMISDIVSMVEKKKAKRVVIDSLSVLRMLIKDQLEYRALSISLVSVLRSKGVTSIFTLEEERGAPISSPETYTYDGIIRLSASSEYGKTTPMLEVVKMRGTDHSYFSVPYRITEEGIKLLKTEDSFTISQSWGKPPRHKK